MTSHDTNEVCLFPAALNGEIRTSLCTPFSDFRYPYAFSPFTWKVIDLIPASSPSSESSTSRVKPFLSAHFEYIRNSMDAQSHDSVPPAPALSLRIALHLSYSPDKRVFILIPSYVLSKSSSICCISGMSDSSFSS